MLAALPGSMDNAEKCWEPSMGCREHQAGALPMCMPWWCPRMGQELHMKPASVFSLQLGACSRDHISPRAKCQSSLSGEHGDMMHCCGRKHSQYLSKILTSFHSPCPPPKEFFLNICFPLKATMYVFDNFLYCTAARRLACVPDDFSSEGKWEQFGTCFWCVFQTALWNLSSLLFCGYLEHSIVLALVHQLDVLIS